VISGMPKQAKIGHPSMVHANSETNVCTHTGIPRMVPQPNNQGGVTDNYGGEGNLDNRNLSHSLRCPVTSPPMETPPPPMRRAPRPEAKPEQEAVVFMGNAPKL
jgi:hypothetical protein